MNSLRSFYDSRVPSEEVSSSSVQLKGRRLTERLAESLPPRSSVRLVDMGCGNGLLTKMAVGACASRGVVAEAIGCDWSAAALRSAQQRGILACRSSHHLGIRSNSIDVVLFSEMIEHLVDPDNALTEIRRVLVADGLLVISTPNLAAWFNRILIAFGVQPVFSEVSLRKVYGRPGKDIVGHLRLYTPRALREMLLDQGFCDVTLSGAPFHALPPAVRPLDDLLSRSASLSAILIGTARRSEEAPAAT